MNTLMYSTLSVEFPYSDVASAHEVLGQFRRFILEFPVLNFICYIFALNVFQTQFLVPCTNVQTLFAQIVPQVECSAFFTDFASDASLSSYRTSTSLRQNMMSF